MLSWLVDLRDRSSRIFGLAMLKDDTSQFLSACVRARVSVCDNSISVEELVWQEVSPNHELWRGGLVSKLQSGEGGKKKEKMMSLAPLLCSSIAPPCLEFVFQIRGFLNFIHIGPLVGIWAHPHYMPTLPPPLQL